MRMINLTPILGAVLIFASCKKEIAMENQNQPNANIVAPVGENGFNAKVDGNLVTGAMQGIIAPESENLVINTTDDEGSISIILPKDVKPGTYDLEYLGAYTATVRKNNNSLVAASGKVTVLERNDSQIKGTFAFAAEDVDGVSKANVEGGSFAVNYTK